ncbi:MAG: TonB-dependent receptor [Cyclobacteriaceae bacterium]
MKRGLILVLLIALGYYAQAQNGYLRGKVIDAETGEGLFGATISLQGTTKGTSADFDGNYSLTLEPGIHTIEFRFFSYQTKTISDIEIKAEEVTLLDISLGTATTELEEIVITAKQARDSEVALMTVQKKSTNLVDGISSQSFKKIGDGDLGGAMKRVTGVAVQGGKHVYVRGLGDRYTKTLVNGMSIPGLDPDKNSVQMDIFPTSTVENVMVFKTFTPDLPGDFTGGLVDVELKNFPEEKNTSVSFSVGYNPDMHLNSDYLTYDGSAADMFAFGAYSRRLPFNRLQVIPDRTQNAGLAEAFTRSFDPTLAAKKSSSPLNYGVSFNHGNQVEKGKYTIGYNAVFNYSNNTEYYDNAEFGEYFRATENEINELEQSVTRIGSLGQNEVSWSALASSALKFDNHNFSLSVLRSQNGVSSAMKRTSADYIFNPAITTDDVLTYTQRAVTNAILAGEHGYEKFDVKWSTSFAISEIQEPDFRETRIENIEDGTYGLNTGVGAGVNRFYRSLDENNASAKVDIKYPIGEKNKLKFGAAATLKNRGFEILDYFFRNVGDQPITEDANFLLQEENIWTRRDRSGTIVKGNFQPSNSYDSRQSIFGVYAMNEMQVLERLKAIYGLRVEQTQMYYTGANQRGETFNDIQTLNELNLLPSANLVYSLQDDMNLRASFNKTLARPTFKEKSYAQIYDPISGRTFIGNTDLNQTNINNYDLRWEYFYSPTEMVSFSTFYKTFEGHIEYVSFETAPDNIKPRNSGNSTVVGVEVEFRKNLTDQLSFGANASFVKSSVDMKSVFVNNQKTKTEYEIREATLREGESLSDTRVMAGQSPFLINGFLNYTDSEGVFNANLAYNVQGETLNIIGSADLPDIYTKPFHSLNFNVYRNLGTDLNSRITMGITNILGSERNNFYKSYGAGDDAIYSLYTPGRTFTVKYSYTF